LRCLTYILKTDISVDTVHTEAARDFVDWLLQNPDEYVKYVLDQFTKVMREPIPANFVSFPHPDPSFSCSLIPKIFTSPRVAKDR